MIGQQDNHTSVPAGKTYTNTKDQLTTNLSQNQTRNQDSLDQNQNQNLIPTLMKTQQELGTLQSLVNLFTKVYNFLKQKTHQELSNHYTKFPHLFRQGSHQQTYTYYRNQQLNALALLHLMRNNPGLRCHKPPLLPLPRPTLPNLRELLLHQPQYHLPVDLLLETKYKPVFMQHSNKMEDLLEVIMEEEEAHQAEDTLEGANQEADQLPPSPRFQYLLLLTFSPWEPYLESSAETGPKPLTLWKGCWDISDPTLELLDLTPQYKELPSPSPSSKGKKSLDGHATWEGGSTSST